MRLSMVRVMARNCWDFLLLLAILALVLVAVSGCQTQPTDAVTGKAFGPSLSQGDARPTTSPAGNPVVEVKTNKLDGEKVAVAVEQGGKIVQEVGPQFGTWGIAISAIVGAAVPMIVGQLRKKKSGTPPVA